MNILDISSQLHTDSTPILEGMFQEKILAFRIHNRSLNFRRVPGGTDLGDLALGSDIEIGCAADHSVVRFEKDGERVLRLSLLRVQPLRDRRSTSSLDRKAPSIPPQSIPRATSHRAEAWFSRRGSSLTNLPSRAIGPRSLVLKRTRLDQSEELEQRKVLCASGGGGHWRAFGYDLVKLKLVGTSERFFWRWARVRFDVRLACSPAFEILL